MLSKFEKIESIQTVFSNNSGIKLEIKMEISMYLCKFRNLFLKTCESKEARKYFIAKYI